MKNFQGFFYSKHYDKEFMNGELNLTYHIHDDEVFDIYEVHGQMKFTGQTLINKIYEFKQIVNISDNINFKTDDCFISLIFKDQHENKMSGEYLISNPYDIGYFQIASSFIILDEEFKVIAPSLKMYEGKFYSLVDKLIHGDLSFEYDIKAIENYQIKGSIKFDKNNTILFEQFLEKGSNNIIIIWNDNLITLSIELSSIKNISGLKLNGYYTINGNLSDSGKFQVSAKGVSLDDEFHKKSYCLIS
jgi:hypothetical protein